MIPAEPGGETAVLLRAFRDGDLEPLAGLYRDSVREIGPQAYDAAQVRAWSRYPEDLEEFCERLGKGLTIVAELAGNVAAFGQLFPDDHVAFLYCAPAYARRGLATRILSLLEEHAAGKGVGTVRTDASRISRPLFEKSGYKVTAVEHVIRHEVIFERFRMEKSLAPAG